MQKLIGTLIILLSTSFAGELIVLETFYPDSMYAFTRQYGDLNFTRAESGDLIVLYALTGDGSYPSYRIKQYPENNAAETYVVGAFWGMGGWYNPTICGFEDQNLLVQEHYVGDVIEQFATYKLVSLDLTPANLHGQKFFFSRFETYIKRVWKTDTTHVAAFCHETGYDEVPRLQFINEIELFDEEVWPEDSSFVVSGDTIMVIDDVVNYSQSKLGTDDIYLSIYRLTDSEHWGFVCLNHDSVVAQGDSILSGSTSRFSVHSRGESFWMFSKPADSSMIKLWTFDTNTHETTVETVYSLPEGSLEYLSAFHSTLMDNMLVLQLPILKDETSTDRSNWYGLINKRISLSDYSVMAIDTIFIFEPQTDVIRSRIISDGQAIHNLFATRTPEYSRLYYFGDNDLVNIDDDDYEMPDKPSISRIYPNPFNPSTTIRYELSETADITVRVYDLQGRDIWSYAESAKSAGCYSLQWNGSNQAGRPVASGVYLISFATPKFRAVQKAVLIR